MKRYGFAEGYYMQKCSSICHFVRASAGEAAPPLCFARLWYMCILCSHQCFAAAEKSSKVIFDVPIRVVIVLIDNRPNFVFSL